MGAVHGPVIFLLLDTFDEAWFTLTNVKYQMEIMIILINFNYGDTFSAL